MADAATEKAASPAEKLARPTKPDEAAYQEQLKKATAEHEAVMEKFNAVKRKVDMAMPNRNKENPSPIQKRRREILDELDQIRSKQAGFKNARTGRTDQIKRLDEQLKQRVAEQKQARGKMPYKSVEELDAHVKELEGKVESGTLSLVNEKKMLTDIANAKKMRRNFGQLDQSQKAIDEIRAKIKEIKDAADDPEQRQMSDRYTTLQAELDEIKAQGNEASKNINGLLAEKDKLNAEQKATFQNIRKIKDDFYNQKRAYKQFEDENRQKHRDRIRAERERQNLERQKAEAERVLEEASAPAFGDQIRCATRLLQYFDPSTKSAEKAPLLADKGLAAQPSRKVDDSGMKGMKLVQKKDREEEYLPAAKKGKKGKKSGASESTPKSFSCPPSVVEDCASIGLDPPMSADDVKPTVEKINEKLAYWKENQDAETKKNIEKAKKSLEKFAKEGDEGAENGTDNKEAGKSDSKVDEVTSKLEETKIADKE